MSRPWLGQQVSAKQLGLQEEADANSDESSPLSERDKAAEEEEEGGVEEEEEEGVEGISAEGLSFLTRLASELDKDEGEPPRRRRPAQGPTVCGMFLLFPLVCLHTSTRTQRMQPFQEEQAEALSSRCGEDGRYLRACKRLMAASPAFKSMKVCPPFSLAPLRPFPNLRDAAGGRAVCAEGGAPCRGGESAPGHEPAVAGACL